MAETSKEWKMPKNIRQIGDGGGNRKVYIEDYVMTFLEGISAEDKQKKSDIAWRGAQAGAESLYFCERRDRDRQPFDG